MVPFFLSIISYIFIYIVYLAGKFSMALYFGIHDKHIFIGFGSNPFFSFSIKKVRISVGLFIPLPFLAKYYGYSYGSKRRIKYEWEFFDHPSQKRLLVIFGGVIAMLLTSMIIFSILEYNREEQYISKEELDKYGIYPSKTAEKYGFMKGDKIISVNDEPIESFNQLSNRRYLIENDATFYGLRGTDSIKIQLDSYILAEFEAQNEETLFYLNAPFKVTEISKGSPAQKAGVEPGDQIRRINDIAIYNIQEVKEILDSLAGDSISMVLFRDNHEIITKALVSNDSKLGFYIKTLVNYSTKTFTLVESVQSGIKKPFKIIQSNIAAVIKMFDKIDLKTELKGPIGVFSNESMLYRFFSFTAIYLVLFCIYDIFPVPRSATIRSIPVWIELILRKRVKISFYNKLNRIAWLIIVGFILWIILNDILMLFIE